MSIHSNTESFSFRRAFAVLKKEFIQLKRDKMTLRMIIALPLMQLLLFGYALNNDPRHLPAAVLSHDHSSFARAVVAGLKNTTYFNIDFEPATESEAQALVDDGRAQFIITIPSDFGRKLVRGERPGILVQADATDPVATSGALSSLAGVVDRVARAELKGVTGDLKATPPPVDVLLQRMYNPEGFTRYNIVPGLIAILLTMTGIMMTAMTMTKERERGSMENLLAMPCRPLEVMMGKIAPYVIIGYIQAFIVVVVAKFLFAIPILGSLWLLAGALFVFITCNMALGFTLSAASQNQAQALQASMMMMMPSIMLSGFLFPFRGMPEWAQWIGNTLPATHFINISRGILLKGNGFMEIWPHFWPQLVFMVLITVLAMKRYRQTLD